MRNYEIMFIVRPDVADEEVDKLIAQMEGVATGAGGKIEKTEKLGRKRLAYRVARQREGFYVLFKLQGGGDMVKEFERRLKVTDSVLKFISVRMDEALELAEKYKALRAKQESKRRRSKPAAPAPPAPATTEQAQA